MSTRNRVAAVAAIVGGLVAAASTASAALNLPTQNCSYSFTANLKKGMRNSQVRDLQKVLNMYPQTTVASTGAGSMGMETDYFGAATMAAVIKFQNLHASDVLTPAGLTTGNGNVFALTRAVLNQICTGNGNTTGTTTTSSNVSVQMGPAVPYTVLVAGQAAAKLADFTFNGNGNVTSVKLLRTGVSNNSTLSNVYLYDGANRLTDSASVLADGSITFNSISGLFSVNGSRTISVRADVASGTSGQSVGVTLTGFAANGGSPASASLVGSNQPIAYVQLATVALSGSNVAAASINAGQINTNVWSQSMSVGTRAVKLHSMTFKFIGSAPVDALANLSLYIDGTKAGNSSMFDMNGRATFDMTSSPMMLNTGSHTVELRADIVKGSNRNFQISVENVADIRVEDRDVPNAFVSVSGTIPNQAGLISVNSGNLTISLDPAFTATQVIGGATNVEIGRYVVKAYGEDVKINTLTVLPVLSGTTPAASGLNNLSLFINGGQVGSSVNWSTGNQTFSSLGSSFYVPAGQTVTLSIKADLMTTGSVNYTAGTVSANLIAGSNNAQGISSSQLTSTSAQTGKTLSVVSGAGSFGTTAGFNAQTINQNTSMVKVGSFTLQASNADALRVTNLAVALSGTVALTSVTNLTVKDGSTVLGTPIGNVSATNNFSVNLNIPASGSKTFDVYADLGTASNGSTLTAGMTATYNSVTNTSSQTSTAAGVAMTIQTASLALGSPAVNANPVSQFVAPGTRDIATFNVKSTNGASVITKLTFNLNAAGLNSITVGGVTKSIISGATSTTIDGLNISIPYTNSGVSVPVTGVFSNVGINAATSGATNTITLAEAEFTSGNTTATTSLAATSSSFVLVSSMPTAVKGSGLYFGTGALSGVKVGTFSVTANASGDINLSTIAINVGMPTGGAFTNGVLKQNGVTVAGVTCTATANFVCTWSSVYRVAAGTTVTFDVFGDSTSITTAGNASVNAGPASSFTWDDTNVTAGALTGSLVTNYGN